MNSISVPTVQSGSALVATTGEQNNVVVTFPTAFVSAPIVNGTVYSPVYPATNFSIIITNVTNTFFTATVCKYNGGSSWGPINISNVYLNWVANSL